MRVECRGVKPIEIISWIYPYILYIRDKDTEHAEMENDNVRPMRFIVTPYPMLTMYYLNVSHLTKPTNICFKIIFLK